MRYTTSHIISLFFWQLSLTIVKRRKLQWYGHVSRSLGLAKTIFQCTVRGGRRQGRQRKRWEDNFREWTGLEFAKSQRAVENREKWRKLVVKSSVVPQWPSRLRDRWWWWFSEYFHVAESLTKYHPSFRQTFLVCLTEFYGGLNSCQP